MIVFIENFGGGHAINTIVQPSNGTTKWRLLRKTSNSFSGHDDPSATLVVETTPLDRVTLYDFLDIQDIVPGETYYYALFEYNGSAWNLANGKSIVSADPIDVISQDPFDVVLDRIEHGFERLGTSAPLVRTIPPNLDRDPLPVVTVKMLQNEVIDWGLACDVIPDEYLDPDWEEHRGWFGKMTVEIKIYATSSLIRSTMRKALQSLIQSNLQVFPSMRMVRDRFRSKGLGRLQVEQHTGFRFDSGVEFHLYHYGRSQSR